MKTICLILCTTVLLMIATPSFAQYAALSCMGGQTVEMNFNGGVITGTVPTATSPVTGMQVRYNNVLVNTPITQQIDAVFTLDAVNFGGFTAAQYPTFVPDANPAQQVVGFTANFQPSFIASSGFYNMPLGTYNLFNTWTVRFYLAGTSTPASLPIIVQTIDNDGSQVIAAGGTQNVFESITYNTTPSSLVTSAGSAGGTPPTTQILSGNTFTVNAPVNQANIGTGREYIAYAYYGNTSAFTFTFNHRIVYSGTVASLGLSTRFSSLHIGCDYSGFTNFSTVTLSGNVFNDINGLTDGTVNGAGVNMPSGTQLYAQLLSEDGKTILASVPVSALGTYSFPVGANSNYQVQITTTNTAVGSAPVTPTVPTNWEATGESNNGSGTSSDGTPNLLTTVTVGATNVNNINFGIQQRPESAVNAQLIGLNPGGTVNTTVDPSWFSTSNVGVNPNTQDFAGGTVQSIRITAFPSNVTSITINGITYGTCGGCTAWPLGGVTIPAPGGIPSQTITVDPIDGLVSVVIPFVSIDNAGSEDLTPGSVTLTYNSTLPIRLVSFTVQSQKTSVLINWVTDAEINVAHYEIEHSINAIDYNIIGIKSAANSRTYSLMHQLPKEGVNYYRLKTVDRDGSITYSQIKTLRIASKGKVDIYPTPAATDISITFGDEVINKPIVISLYNQQGQELMRKQISRANATEVIDIANYANGTYQLRVTSNTELITNRKVVIMK